MKATENNLLGICIPTYNRVNYLEQCLNSIIHNISKFEFPIYISDNASPDGTYEFVSRIKDLYDKIEYGKNERNIGPYLNIINVINMAKTDYIWLMGDDDAIKENKVDKLIETLKAGYDYVILNSVPYDSELKNLKSDKIITCSTDKPYLKGQSGNLLVDLKKWAYHGFMSSMIIKTNLLSDVIQKYEDEEFVLYNNMWSPMALFYEAIKESSGIFLCEPIVLNRDNPRASGKDFWTYMYIDRIKAIEYLGENGYSLELIKNSLDFKIVGTIFIGVISKCSNPSSILFNLVVKKDEVIPFYIKSIILIVDKTPLFLIKKINAVINKMRTNRKSNFNLGKRGCKKIRV